MLPLTEYGTPKMGAFSSEYSSGVGDMASISSTRFACLLVKQMQQE
jgi:hypothetical protein